MYGKPPDIAGLYPCLAVIKSLPIANGRPLARRRRHGIGDDISRTMPGPQVLLPAGGKQHLHQVFIIQISNDTSLRKRRLTYIIVHCSSHKVRTTPNYYYYYTTAAPRWDPRTYPTTPAQSWPYGYTPANERREPVADERWVTRLLIYSFECLFSTRFLLAYLLASLYFFDYFLDYRSLFRVLWTLRGKFVWKYRQRARTSAIK
ncbi:hypothetical protein COOONC_21074 [Cooperia oncophora]